MQKGERKEVRQRERQNASKRKKEKYVERTTWWAAQSANFLFDTSQYCGRREREREIGFPFPCLPSRAPAMRVPRTNLQRMDPRNIISTSPPEFIFSEVNDVRERPAGWTELKDLLIIIIVILESGEGRETEQRNRDDCQVKGKGWTKQRFSFLLPPPPPFPLLTNFESSTFGRFLWHCYSYTLLSGTRRMWNQPRSNAS